MAKDINRPRYKIGHAKFGHGINMCLCVYVRACVCVFVHPRVCICVWYLCVRLGWGGSIKMFTMCLLYSKNLFQTLHFPMFYRLKTLFIKPITVEPRLSEPSFNQLPDYPNKHRISLQTLIQHAGLTEPRVNRIHDFSIFSLINRA